MIKKEEKNHKRKIRAQETERKGMRNRNRRVILKRIYLLKITTKIGIKSYHFKSYDLYSLLDYRRRSFL